MIATTPQAFLAAVLANRDFAPQRPIVPRALMVVSPIGFRVSEQSAADNVYMTAGTEVDSERAHAQHSNLVRKLNSIGVPVLVLPGREGLDDAVYPNNVYATIPGRFIVGSMYHQVRRPEADREDVRELFARSFSYEIVDLSRGHCVAELTGPLVLDRGRGLGFCGMTQRVDEQGVQAMHDAFDLRLTFRFDLAANEYHTNLVLAVLASRSCLIHVGSFADRECAEAICGFYGETAVRLSDEEKNSFAANCLAVTERDVLFSATARSHLEVETRARLEKAGFRLHAVEIDELEKGGGSLRCLLAEIF